MFPTCPSPCPGPSFHHSNNVTWNVKNINFVSFYGPASLPSNFGQDFSPKLSSLQKNQLIVWS